VRGGSEGKPGGDGSSGGQWEVRMIWIIGGGIYFVVLVLSLGFLKGVSILNVENERECSKSFPMFTTSGESSIMGDRTVSI
jgi:hypothetical protein